MLSVMSGFGPEVVAVRAVGKVYADDDRTILVPAVERATAGGRNGRLLMVLGDGFDGYDAGAIFADTSLGAEHFKASERIAEVTDTERLRGAIHLFGGLIPGEVRLFSVPEGPAAQAWIAEAAA